MTGIQLYLAAWGALLTGGILSFIMARWMFPKEELSNRLLLGLIALTLLAYGVILGFALIVIPAPTN